jgi:hypothetical protein
VVGWVQEWPQAEKATHWTSVVVVQSGLIEGWGYERASAGPGAGLKLHKLHHHCWHPIQLIHQEQEQLHCSKQALPAGAGFCSQALMLVCDFEG